MNNILIPVMALIIGAFGGYTYGVNSGPAMDEHSMMHSSMEGMMAGVEGKSGAELEEAFLKEMIVHHEGAVDMAKVLGQGGVRPELATFGAAIIDVQSKEIDMMKGWLKEWFNKEI
jgi:uncharacterized protein (DUF305 family)